MSAAAARPLAPRDHAEAASEATRRRAEAQALLARPARCGAALVAALGAEAAAFALDMTPAAVATLAAGTPAVRRRLHARLCERLGLPAAAAPTLLDALPRTEPGLARAVFAFAVALEIAGAPRVLGRDAYAGLVEAYGATAIGFALEHRTRLRDAPDAGTGRTAAPLLARRAGARFVATLAEAGHPLAGAVAARLAEPLPQRRGSSPSPAPSPAGAARSLAVALEALRVFRAEEDEAAFAPQARDDAPEEQPDDATPRASVGAAAE